MEIFDTYIQSMREVNKKIYTSSFNYIFDQQKEYEDLILNPAKDKSLHLEIVKAKEEALEKVADYCYDYELQDLD